MIAKRSSMAIVVLVCVTLFFALFGACGAVAGNSIRLEDRGRKDIRLARSQHDTVAVVNPVLGFQYKSIRSPLEDINGPKPKRIKGTTRKLMAMSKALAEKDNSLDTSIQSRGYAVSNKGVSKNTKRRPSSGIQTTLSPLQQNKVVLWNQMSGLEFQERDKSTSTPLRSTVRSLSDTAEQQSPKQGSSIHDRPAKVGAKEHAPATESQTVSVSGSTPYESNQADLSDIVGMDYGRVSRKPPIHNSSAP